MSNSQPSQVSREPSSRGLFLLLTAIVLPTLVTYVYFDLLASYPPLVQKTAYAIGKTVQFLLPVVVIAGVVRPWRPLGSRSWSHVFLFGAISGVLISGAIYAGYRWLLMPLGVMTAVEVEAIARVEEVGIASPAAFAALALGYVLIHSLLEEYYWRWFVYGQLRRQTGIAAAVAISSLGFMAHHVLVLARFFGWDNPWTYIASAGVAFGGAAWAIGYEKTRSLLGIWISHAAVDAIIFWIGYELVRGQLAV